MPAAGAGRGARDSDLRLASSLVTMTVTVSDRFGRCVTGLDQRHFEVYDNKVRQQIAFFSSEDAPATVGIVYDLSGSMRERIQRAHHALRRFLETCHPDDEFFVVGYNTQVGLLQDFSPSAATTFNNLTLASPQGRTALYDAVFVGLEKARQGRHARKVLVLVSDGQDNASRYTFREVERAARESGVIVYSIGIVMPRDHEVFGYYPVRVLQRVAETTGGRAFFCSSDETLQSACHQIALEIRSLYSIGFYPSDVDARRSFRRLRVRVAPPPGHERITARTRSGYTPAAP